MVHLLIFGATGPSGQQVVERALSAGHHLTLYVRSPQKLSDAVKANPLVRVVKGDLKDEDALESCFSFNTKTKTTTTGASSADPATLSEAPALQTPAAAADASPADAPTPSPSLLPPLHAKVSAMGPVFGQPAGSPITQGYKIVLRLMKTYGIAHIVVLSTPSCPNPEHDHMTLFWKSAILAVKTGAHSMYEDIVETGKLMRSDAARGLSVTLARVPVLTNASHAGKLVVGYIGDHKVGSTLSRYDLGTFFVQEGVEPAWSGDAPLVTSG